MYFRFFFSFLKIGHFQKENLKLKFENTVCFRFSGYKLQKEQSYGKNEIRIFYFLIMCLNSEIWKAPTKALREQKKVAIKPKTTECFSFMLITQRPRSSPADSDEREASCPCVLSRCYRIQAVLSDAGKCESRMFDCESVFSFTGLIDAGQQHDIPFLTLTTGENKTPSRVTRHSHPRWDKLWLYTWSQKNHTQTNICV